LRVIVDKGVIQRRMRCFADADGRRLRARLVESSREADPVDGVVRVYTLHLDAGVQPKSLTVRNALVFEQFSTEQNLVLVLVLVLAMPGGRRRSLDFSARDDTPQTRRSDSARPKRC